MLRRTWLKSLRVLWPKNLEPGFWSEEHQRIRERKFWVLAWPFLALLVLVAVYMPELKAFFRQ